MIIASCMYKFCTQKGLVFIDTINQEIIGSYSPHLSLKIIESANHGYTGKETDLYDTIHGFLKSV